MTNTPARMAIGKIPIKLKGQAYKSAIDSAQKAVTKKKKKK